MRCALLLLAASCAILSACVSAYDVGKQKDVSLGGFVAALSYIVIVQVSLRDGPASLIFVSSYGRFPRVQSVITLVILVAGFSGYLVDDGSIDKSSGAKKAVAPSADAVGAESAGAAAPALRYSPGDGSRGGVDAEAAAGVAQDSLPLGSVKVRKGSASDEPVPLPTLLAANARRRRAPETRAAWI